MMSDVLPPLEETIFTNEDERCFQQDSVLSHKKQKNAKMVARAHPRFR